MQPNLRKSKISSYNRRSEVWGYHWTTVGVLLASVGFLIVSVITEINHSLFTLVLIVACYPVYLLAVKTRAAHSSNPTPHSERSRGGVHEGPLGALRPRVEARFVLVSDYERLTNKQGVIRSERRDEDWPPKKLLFKARSQRSMTTAPD